MFVTSLKSKMIIPTLGMLFVVVGFIAVYFSTLTANRASSFAEERMEAATRSVQAYLSAHERQTLMVASAMGSSGELARLIQAGVREDIWEYVFERKVFLGVNEIIVASHEGITLARSHMRHSYGDNVSGVPSIAAGLRGEVLTLFTPTPTAAMVMTTAAPVFYGAPSPGSVVVNFVVGSNEFLDRVYETFAVDTMVFMGNTSVSSTIVNPETGQRAVGLVADPEIVAAVVQQGRHVPLHQDLFGAPYLAYYFPLRGAAGNPIGMFFVGICQRVSAAEVSAAQRNTYLLAFLTLVVVGAILLILTSRILRPIRLLTGALNDTAQGDLTKRLPELGKDEIAEASRSFNLTMEELRKMITAIKGQAGKLSDIGNDLASNMSQTASAMNEIAANIQNVKGRVMNQNASVTHTNASMEQVTVNIDKLSGSVEQQTGAVSEAASALEQVMANINSVTQTLVKNIANVENLKEASNTGRVSIQDVVSDIQEIARESEGLLEINAVMENIASQTNLLSMNAAIEAARAGESGKGFAVVAGEIRQLAESSSGQSRVIGEVLNKIKGSIDKITRSTDNVLNKFEAIDQSVNTVAEQEEAIRHAMEEQSHGSRQVLSASGQVNDITQQVKGGALEMREGSKEVIQESKNLERTTQEITNGINEMAVSTEEVNRAVSSVNDLSGRNRENISTLVRAVSQFKV
ncbi:MAG: methyl-accepting chemotaxis protein [Treponema sp.]|nr:methyl-accepting chemotaxis protein [Treponema sp.]